MMFVNAEGARPIGGSPFGGISGRLSTNPLIIAAPSSGGFPVVLDVATSIAPEGRIRTLKTEGRPVPPGWIVKSSGGAQHQSCRPVWSPPGSRPVGGHKGSGLAFMIDVLAGGLSGAGCCHGADAPMEGKTDGILFLALPRQRLGLRKNSSNRSLI